MPQISVSVEHKLNRHVAKVLAEEGIRQGIAEHGTKVDNLTIAWDGETAQWSFRVYGQTISGTVTIDDEAVAVVGKIPFIALPYRGRIETGIRDHLSKALGVT